jgi:hypothetical protein
MPWSAKPAFFFFLIAAFGCLSLNHGTSDSISQVSTGGRDQKEREGSDVKGKLAKREGPPEVAPVTIGNTKFVTIHWGKSRGLGQNGGYIAALDAATETELWILKVYDVKYDAEKEQDVQDVFIESMSKAPSGNMLVIRDENGRIYVVDAITRAVSMR